MNAWRWALVAVAVFALSACDDDPDGNGDSNITFENNVTSGDGGMNNVSTNNNNNNNDTTFNNLTEGCDNVECDDGERCVRGACVPEAALVACEAATDLGMLNPSMDALTANGDTTDFIDSTTTQCGSIGAFSGAENAFSFTVTSPAVLNLELTTEAAVDWAMEVRADNCFDRNARVICSDPETTSFAVQPGRTYFLIVEPASTIDKGAFTVEGTFSSDVCSPPGSLRCVDDTQIALCFGGEEERLFDCAGGCTDDACGGNSCDTAIDVTESTTITGALDGYSDDFNFDDEASCSPDGSNGIAGEGNDFVVRFPGLTAGQTVTLDGSGDFIDQAFYLLDSCSPSSTCTIAVDLTDRLQFTADTDGDYYVLVDVASGSSRGDFEVEVTVQ